MRTLRHLLHQTARSLLLSGLCLGGAALVFGGVATADEVSAGTVSAGDWPEAAVGQVTSIAGHVVAERPGEPPRPLHCHDHVYRGERVVTADSSRVGVLMDDVYAHLAASTAVLMDTTPRASSDLTLESGGIRVIDPRNDGADVRLAVLDASAQVLGNDTEAYVFSEKTGRYAMLCEWDEPLPVARGSESVRADPGKCAIAKPKEPLYLANAHDERIALSADDRCDRRVGALEIPLLPDVAAAPLAPWSLSGTAGPSLARASCDTGCRGAVVVVPLPVNNQPFPGAGP